MHERLKCILPLLTLLALGYAPLPRSTLEMYRGNMEGEATILANLTESKNCKRHFIKLSVSSDGKSYVILNSRNKEERNYRSTQ